MQQFLAIDAPALVTALCCALSCALLGNFLVLRRQSMMGDAISHVVLPGVVGAFLLSGSREAVPMFAGAVLAAVGTAIMIEILRHHGRLDGGASMGVVFALAFALGIFLIEQASARGVDLDPDCVIHGQLERIFWFPPSDLKTLLEPAVLAAVPREVWSAALVLAISVVFVWLFHKELVLCSFDPELGSVLGFPAGRINVALMTMVALAAVASFEAVGSILVIAMLVCPAAIARQFCDSVRSSIIVSCLAATCAVIVGYICGAEAPHLFGARTSLSAAGMITCVLGILCGGAVLFAPRYGVCGRLLRKQLTLIGTLREDLLAALYRDEELGPQGGRYRAGEGFVSAGRKKLALWLALQQGEVQRGAAGLELTARGRSLANSLIRSHRLWESFMVSNLSWAPDHVHPSAEEFEHVTSIPMQQELQRLGGSPATDPHDRPIPEGSTAEPPNPEKGRQ